MNYLFNLFQLIIHVKFYLSIEWREMSLFNIVNKELCGQTIKIYKTIASDALYLVFCDDYDFDDSCSNGISWVRSWNNSYEFYQNFNSTQFNLFSKTLVTFWHGIQWWHPKQCLKASNWSMHCTLYIFCQLRFLSVSLLLKQCVGAKATNHLENRHVITCAFSLFNMKCWADEANFKKPFRSAGIYPWSII